MALSSQQMKAAIEVFQDKDFVAQMIAEAESKTADLEAAGVAHKGDPQTQPAEAQPQEIQLNMEDLAAEVGKQFATDLTPIAEAITTMANTIKEMGGRLEKLEGTKRVKDLAETPKFVFNLQRASEAKETVTDDDALKNMKPVETKTKAGDPWSEVFSK